MTTLFDETCIVCDSYNIKMVFGPEKEALYDCRDCGMEWDEFTAESDDFWNTSETEEFEDDEDEYAAVSSGTSE